MSEVYIDASALSAASESVTSLASRLAQHCDQLSSLVSGLSGVWQGEDADGCISMLKQSVSQLQTQTQYYPAFAQALAASSALWSKFEQEGVSGSSAARG